MDSKIAVKDCKDEIIFKVEGEFDNLLCIKYKSAITEIIARRRNALTIFDLSNVTFIDNSNILFSLLHQKRLYKIQSFLHFI